MDTRSGFDKLAPFYRAMEKLLAGKQLQQARTAHLDKLPTARRVLMLGEGPGRLLEQLIETQPDAEFWVVDQSRHMLHRARQAVKKRAPKTIRISWLRQNVLIDGIPEGPFDLVTTPFFLDCFRQEQLQALIPAISTTIRAQGHWLLSDFQIPTDRSLRKWRARAIHWIMYAFFNALTRIPATRWEDPDPLLSKEGFILRKRKEYNMGLIRSDLWKKEF